MGKQSKSVRPVGLPVLRPNVAGVDLGSREHWVAGPVVEGGEANVRVFTTITDGLNQMADWLVAQGVAAVAMESTSVYWIPLYETLEARGLTVLLVNARQLRGVPGRKTDMRDCQWLQMLLSCGLLRGSFRPPDDITRLRTLHRQMSNLTEERTRAVQWMQKALDQMNVQVHRAMSELTGTTGLAIVRAIVAGERDPAVLAKLRDKRCRKSAAEIARYLTGTWREEHIFNLSSALRLFDFVESELAQYQRKLDAELAGLEPPDARDKTAPPNPKATKERAIVREDEGARRDRLYRVAGVDLTRIDGIGVGAASTIIDELGTKLTAFPSEKHFVSWLRLCPRTGVSGGKPVTKKKGGMGSNRVAAVLRMAATAVGRTRTAIGAYYRRVAHRKDGAVAVFATARKLAQHVYRMLRFGQACADEGEKAYEEALNQRRIKALKASARELGYDLVATPSGTSVP